MSRGKLITLEGIEGCGKSLQVELLSAELKRLGLPILCTREPGGTPFGTQLRKILLRHDEIQRCPVSELLLYLADRYEHLKSVIEPGLADGLLVLSDRYHDATLAYQGYARNVGMELIEKLADVLQLRKSDLTLVLDVEVEVGLKRARSRDTRTGDRQWGRFESEELDFHRRVRDGYHRLAAGEPQRVRIVDGAGDPPQILQRIMAVLREYSLLNGAIEK